MFVTKPALEQQVPTGIGDEECRYWLAVLFSFESPWFLLTYTTSKGRHPRVQTIAVAWETTLAAMLEPIGVASVLALRYIAPSRVRRGLWSMKDVCEMWSASDHELRQTGPLIFRFRNETDLADCFEQRASPDHDGRKLLLSIGADRYQ